MKYNKYIVSFVAGSSGRFVVQVLDRILLQKKDLITITEYNSAHADANDIYTGHSIGEPHHPKVFEILNFDSPSTRNYPFSNILSTHVYPNFKVINSRFDDVGIILIRPEQDDAKEIAFNSWYKNRNIVLDVDMLEKKAKRAFLDDIKFFSNDEYPKNCLVIKYKELYQIENNKHIMLEKLKKFTGIEEVPDIAVTACNQYIEGRDRLTKQFNLR
jgi:hypothetical protein